MQKLIKISSFSLSSLLRQQKDPKSALKLFVNPGRNLIPDDKPFRYSHLCYDLIISKLGRNKMLEEMENVLQMLKHDTRIKPKEIIFCNVITFYGRALLPQKALQFFWEIPSFRCRRSVKSANTLLSSLLMCREFNKMKEIFDGFDCFGGSDVCTYNILINASIVNGDLDQAWNLFEEMENRGYQPTLVTFGTLISGLCSHLKIDEALQLKRKMISDYNVQPDGFVCSALVKALCKSNELDLAIKLKEEVVQSEVELPPAVYSALISGLFKSGRRRQALKLVGEMIKKGCKMDTVTYNAIIHGLCQEKDFDYAFSVLDELEGKGFKPDVISYNVIIGALCSVGKLREASNLFQNMPRRRCPPDVVSYRMLFDGFCDGMHYEEAVRHLDEMICNGYAPRPAHISKLINSLVQRGDRDLLFVVLDSLCKGKLIDVKMWEQARSMVCKEHEVLMLGNYFVS